MILGAALALVVQAATVEQWTHWTHLGCVGAIALKESLLVAGTSGGVAFGTLSGTQIVWDSVWTYPGELPHSDVRAAVFDTVGTLWIGTWGGGLDAWEPDGDHYHFGQLEGLPIGQQVGCVLPDTSVFAGTRQGLAIRDFGYFQVWTQQNTGGGLPGNNVTALVSCDSGLFVGTASGVSLLRSGMYPGDLESWVTYPEMLGRNLRGMCRSGDTLWAATESGLDYLAPGGSWTRLTGYTGSSPLCLAAVGGILAAGENGSVEVRQDGSWSSWAVPPGMVVRALVMPSEGVALAGLNTNLSSTRDFGYGIACGWNGYWGVSSPEGLQANDLRAVDTGPGGDCWVSTNHRGIAVLHDGGWTAFEGRLPNDHQIFALECLDGGSVFAAPYHYGLGWLDWAGTPDTADDSGFSWSKGNSGLLNDQVTSISASPSGTVWFGMEPYFATPEEPSGVSRLEWTEGDQVSASWSGWTAGDGLPSGRVGAVEDAGAGTAWAGTESGLALLGPGDGEVQAVYGASEGLPSADVRALLRTRSGRLYIGTTSGMAVIEGPGVQPAPVTGVTGTVSSLCEDHLGGVWAASSDGLYRIAWNGTIETYTPVNSPLLSLSVTGLSADPGEGAVYAATSDNGLWRLSLGQGTAGDGSRAFLYPNPFLPGRGEVLGLAGIPDEPFTFRVFDLTGGLVYESALPGRDDLAWNGLDAGGEPVASGIYIVEAGLADQTLLLKLAVVR
ncbi:hypothetical protein GX411_02775 [Candidatus Fermentibacteria bacterium]|nr:hypothetical protein [Candidatus Fermentibacteria bacterium]